MPGATFFEQNQWFRLNISQGVNTNRSGRSGGVSNLYLPPAQRRLIAHIDDPKDAWLGESYTEAVSLWLTDQG